MHYLVTTCRLKTKITSNMSSLLEKQSSLKKFNINYIYIWFLINLLFCYNKNTYTFRLFEKNQIQNTMLEKLYVKMHRIRKISQNEKNLSKHKDYIKSNIEKDVTS